MRQTLVAPRMTRAQQSLLRRVAPLLVSTALALGLAACGGGDMPVTFDVGVMVAGQPLAGVQVVPGPPQSISIVAGQSIELDANEPVDWTLYVGDSAITSTGVAVDYGGVSITETAISDSRIAVDTATPYALPAPVWITFVATSTIDSAQVATVNVQISN